MATRTLALSFATLPHLPPEVLVRSSALARAVAARAGARSFAVRGLGRVTIRLESVDLLPWHDGRIETAEERSCTFALVRAASIARLSLDPFLALALVRCL